LLGDDPRSDRETGVEVAVEANLEYLRRLYANVLEWHDRSQRTAQVLLTLDGVIITIGTAQFAGVSAGRPAVIAMGAFLIIAVYCAVESLFGHLGETKLRRISEAFGADPSRPTTYNPNIAWWFGTIAALSQDKAARREQAHQESLHGLLLPFLRIPRRQNRAASDAGAAVHKDHAPNRVSSYLLSADSTTEREALASEIVTLSQQVLINYRWLNRGWASSGLGLLAAILTWWS
jgi:hypothetical protein